MMMSRGGMRIYALRHRIDMDDGVREIRNSMQQLMFSNLGNLMTTHHRQIGVDAQSDLRQQPVSRPACSYFAHFINATDGGYRLGDSLDNHWIDGIEEALTNTTSGLITDDQDCARDQKTDDWVGPMRPQCDADGSDEHEERCDTVSAGMEAICFQRSRTNPAAHPDPVLRYQFVAYCPDDGGSHDEAEVGNGPWVKETVDGFVTGKSG